MIFLYKRIYKIFFFSFQMYFDTLKFKLIDHPLSWNFSQCCITFAKLEFRIKSPINYPKTLRSSNLYPTHNTNSTQLTVPARTAIYWHFSLSQWPWLQEIKVCVSLLEILKKRISHGTPFCRNVCCVWNVAFGILCSAVNYRQ